MATTDGPEVGSGNVSPGRLRLRLYVATGAPNSISAIENLRQILEQSGRGGDADVEIIDVFDDPRRTLEDRIRVTPTLIKVAPPPQARLMGSLDNAALVRQALRLEEERG